jgi:hypothetical protein
MSQRICASDDHEEDHHRGMHREQHRISFGRDLTALGGEQQLAQDRHIRPGIGELPANAEGEQAADEKPDQRAEQKLNADDFVIAREDVFRPDAAGVGVIGVRMIVGVGACGDGTHDGGARGRRSGTRTRWLLVCYSGVVWAMRWACCSWNFSASQAS